MKTILIIICLLLSGCHSAPKGISDRDLLMIAVGQSLQTSMNVQNMEKSHNELLRSLK